MPEEALESSLASRAATTAMIHTAEALWALSTGLAHVAEALDRTATRIGDRGHGVLDWWAAECERRGW